VPVELALTKPLQKHGKLWGFQGHAAGIISALGRFAGSIAADEPRTAAKKAR